jgi:Mn2+/Fe2+ NRAMP family transporter
MPESLISRSKQKMKTHEKYKQSRIKTLIGMSIIAPTLWCLSVEVSFADNTNTPPVEGSQKALAVDPQQSESGEPSVTQPDESCRSGERA